MQRLKIIASRAGETDISVQTLDFLSVPSYFSNYNYYLYKTCHFMAGFFVVSFLCYQSYFRLFMPVKL